MRIHHKKSLTALITSCLLLSACSHLPQESKTIYLDRTLSSSDAQVLAGRLSQKSFAISSVGNKGATLVGTGGRLPDEHKIRSLLAPQGRLTAQPDAGKTWLVNSGKVPCEVRLDENGSTLLYLTLDATATDALARLTKHHIDQSVTFSLDSEPLMIATIREPITSKTLAIHTNHSIEEAHSLCAIIGSGVLSAPIVVQSVE
ncbi:SecDF P1 head subdomain-containing protein [Chitinibacteraceae bacterium HSL-7]